MRKHNYTLIDELKTTIKKRNRTILILMLPAFIGYWNILGFGFGWLNDNYFVPKKIEILNKSVDGLVEAGSYSDTLPDVTALSVVTPMGEESETLSSPSTGIEQLIEEKFGDAADTMIAVAKAESGLNQYAIHYNANGTTDCGVTQINVPGKGCPPELFDVQKNLNKAKELYDRRGFQPWVAYNTGAFKKFIN